MNNLYDVHAHFLPAMDDGCQTPEEALLLLQAAKAQGVEGMLATPHYYPVESVEQFLQRRQAAEERLKAALADWDTSLLPRIAMGAEVAYHPGLGLEENLQQVCLGNSKYLLLEMPFTKWTTEMFRTVRNISMAGWTPVIAHLERYLHLQSGRTVAQLLEQDVLVQMNAGTLLRFMRAFTGRRLLKQGTVQLLGSDCHNTTNRPPNLGAAMQTLEKHGMAAYASLLQEQSMELFTQADKKC